MDWLKRHVGKTCIKERDKGERDDGKEITGGEKTRKG